MYTLEVPRLNQDSGSEALAVMGITDESTVNLWYAHPDDEAAANPALLRALQAAGAVIHIAHASVGEVSTVGDPEIVQRGGRMDESADFCSSFGIPLDNQHVFGLPDGQLHRQPHKLLGGIAMLANQTNATHLVVPALHRYEQRPHRDHRMVWKAGRDLGRIVGLMGWPLQVWSHASPDSAPVSLPVDGEEKVGGFRHFPTQFTFDPKGSAGVDFYGHIVSQKTADDLGQYEELFKHEHYGPHRSVDLLFPNRAFEAIEIALKRAGLVYQRGAENRHPTSGARVYNTVDLVR